MEPTYLHQTYLPVPFPALHRTCWTQPFSDASIVKWLIANRNDSLRDISIPSYLALTDVPSDQVLCSVYASGYEVCSHMLSCCIYNLDTLVQMIDELYAEEVTLYSLFIAVDIPKSSGID